MRKDNLLSNKEAITQNNILFIKMILILYVHIACCQFKIQSINKLKKKEVNWKTFY